MKRVCSLLLIIIFGLGATARQGVFVSGTVEDQSGAAMTEMSLTLTSKATGEARKAKTDSSGAFSFKDVAPGEYTLRAEAEGFKSAKVSVNVGAAPLTGIRVKMEVSISEEVSVEAKETTPVSPENNTGLVYLNSESLSSLPSQGQNVLSVISNFLSPGALGTDGPSIIIDGVEGNDLSLPPASLRQVFINKNPYAAEYRRPGTARVEVVTRNGSRGHYDGSFAYYGRNSAFDARNAFALTRPDFSRDLFDGSFSGRLPFDSTRFFVSGSRLSSDETAIVNALTLAGPFTENVPVTEKNTNLLARIDVRPGDSKRFTFIYSFYDQTERNDEVGGLHLAEQGESRDKRGHKVRFSNTLIFSESFLNDVRFKAERRNEVIGTVADRPEIEVIGAFVGGPSQTARTDRETRFELQDIATITRGAHTMRLGGVFNPRFFSFTDASNFGGAFVFSNLAEFAARTPTLFRIATGNPRASFSQHEANLFFQDEIRLRQNLNLTAGLRYDWQARIGDRNNFAPRLAVAYAPGKGRTVIRAGAGIFYDRLSDRATQRSLLIDGTTIREVIISRPSFDDPLNSGDQVRVPPSVWRIAPELQSPYLFQGSLAVERSLRGGTQLTVEYQTLRGVHLFRSRDINAPLFPRGPRPDPNFLLVRQVESTGTLRGNALVTSLQGRVIKPLKVKAQYTLSRTKDDVSSLFDLPANSRDLRAERGRSDFDKLHRFNFAGILELPWDFRVGSVMTLASGAPFDITTGFDDDGDSIVNDRPVGVRRNTGKGPGFAQLDLRLSKLLDLPMLFNDKDKDRGGFRRLELNLDVFNALNRNNLTDVIGELSSPLFGRPNASLQARTFQFSVRFNFRAYRK